MSIREFSIEISDAEIADLHQRLDNTRWCDEIADDDWKYGADLSWMRRLCDYWRNDFDWRAQEAQLRRFEHFIADTANGSIHFMRRRSRHKNARPLIITHGWPGSVFEFMKIVEPLADPEAHGGRAEDAFEVICPSLPGFGFSPPATTPGMDPKRAAACQVELMKQLDCGAYIAQGGDWGAMVSSEMGRQDPDNCAGVHLNMVVAMPPEGEEDPMAGLSDEEKLNMQTSEEFSKEGMGYFHIQSTKPQTLSYALNDSPAGLAAWIAEKFRAWSDCDGDIESVYTLDELLANISLYWFTRSAGSSARMYYETMHNPQDSSRVEVPTGAALFPKELMKAPRKWADAAYNIVHWNVMPRGGHFAAMEQPELLVKDIRAFAAALKN